MGDSSERKSRLLAEHENQGEWQKLISFPNQFPSKRLKMALGLEWRKLVMVKRGLFVGRFQPIHKGHVKAIKDVLKQVDELVIEGVTYVPKDSIQQETKVINVDGTDCAYEIGKSYLIRTVTMIQIGRVKRITGRCLVLEGACWVADTGRFGRALSTGELNEVEMFTQDVNVHFGAMVDSQEWTHKLPTKTK